ncbi:hypothetical protein [uncultured Sphingomonas sp.]|uniref:hypothetical protein n=1 Tax=uncultured Sphingomonas sp. TaxID=158754 RepID=UPI0026027B44|nr:hypothetical protein [uncultured Sphingomonas sp.]
MRTGADEAAAPKYSHIERERRFRVDPALLPPLPRDHMLIEDLYISATRIRLRRMTDSATGEIAHKLAKKYDAADPLARAMVNAYLTASEYAVFASLPGRPIVKRRYPVMAGDAEFGVDVFAGDLDGLVLAEIEAPDAAALAGIPIPAWTVGEVSHDPRFQGGALAALDRAAARALIAAV